MATFAMLLDVFMSRSDILEICPYGVLVNIIMCFYSVSTGIWGAKNSSALLSSVETYLAFSMICVVICYISKEERNIDWLTNIIIIICIIVGIYQNFRGYYYVGYGYILGETQNPNGFGIIMCLGIFCLAYRTKNRTKGVLPYFILYGFFLYAIVNCGSRKSLIAAIIISVLWLLPMLIEVWKQSDTNSRIVILTFLVLLVFGIYFYISRIYINTVSFQRMLRLGGDDEISNAHRRLYYKYALEYLGERPLFGIGLAQFTYWNPYHQYAHSTYAECIADWGLVGSVIYFYPVIIVGVKLLRMTYASEKRYQTRLILALWVMELFLGIGTIWFYDSTHLVTWTIIYMYGNLYLDENVPNLVQYKYIKA